MSLTTMLTKKSPEYSRIVFSTVVWKLRNDVIYSLLFTPFKRKATCIKVIVFGRNM